MALDKKEKAIELQGITKTFGSVVANDHINLEVRRGEILAIAWRKWFRKNNVDEYDFRYLSSG